MTNEIATNGYIYVHLNFFIPGEVEYTINIGTFKIKFNRKFDIKSLAKKLITDPISFKRKEKNNNETGFYPYEDAKKEFSDYKKRNGLEKKLKSLKYYVSLLPDEFSYESKEVARIKFSNDTDLIIYAIKEKNDTCYIYENDQYKLCSSNTDCMYYQVSLHFSNNDFWHEIFSYCEYLENNNDITKKESINLHDLLA